MSKTFGFDEFMNALSDLESNIEKESIKLLDETGKEAESETRLRTPVGVGTPDPGNLRRSIQADSVKDLSVRVGSSQTAPYARWVEEGHATRSGGYVQGRFMLRDGTKVAEKNFLSKSEKVLDRVTKEFHL